ALDEEDGERRDDKQRRDGQPPPAALDDRVDLVTRVEGVAPLCEPASHGLLLVLAGRCRASARLALGERQTLGLVGGVTTRADRCRHADLAGALVERVAAQVARVK